MQRQLQTVSEVIEILGGLAATARLVDRTYQAQHANNWQEAGRFPAKTYVVISNELKSRGYDAPLRLWGMVEPEAAQ